MIYCTRLFEKQSLLIKFPHSLTRSVRVRLIGAGILGHLQSFLRPMLRELRLPPPAELGRANYYLNKMQSSNLSCRQRSDSVSAAMQNASRNFV